MVVLKESANPDVSLKQHKPLWEKEGISRINRYFRIISLVNTNGCKNSIVAQTAPAVKLVCCLLYKAYAQSLDDYGFSSHFTLFRVSGSIVRMIFFCDICSLGQVVL